MLARFGPIPTGGGWVFEPKCEGYRALACTHGRLGVRSRRGWDLTALLPELDELAENVQLDGEIVALDERGLPDFPSARLEAAARSRRDRPR
jgi:bifunctional non-homologous end joining protein LigD